MSQFNTNEALNRLLNTIGQDTNTLFNILVQSAANYNAGNVKHISSLADFPTPESGVILLEEDTAYFIKGTVDLGPNRLQVQNNTAIFGTTSETSWLISSSPQAMIFGTGTVPIQFISLSAPVLFDITGSAADAYDLIAVNFVDCPNIGTINGSSNFVMTNCAMLNSGGLKLDGTHGTIAINNTIMVGYAGTTIVKIEPTCVVNARFRIIYSTIRANVGVTGLDVSALATIPTEAYILDTVNFSAGGTYLTGIDHTSNKSLFLNCRGITNTAVNGQLYMQNNVTATTVLATSTFYKVAGTTIASPDNSKFDHSNNRLTCRATITRKYLIQCNLSFTAGNANVCQFGFFDSQLNTVRTPSRTKATANAAGRAENVSFSCVVTMKDGDYLEIHAANISAINNIVVDEINFVVTEIK